MSNVLVGNDINGIQLSGTTFYFMAGGVAQNVTALVDGSVTTAKLANGAVTVGKMANLAAGTLLGNTTGSAAAPAAQNQSAVRTFLGLGTAAYAATGDFDAAGAAATAQANAEAASDPVGSAAAAQAAAIAASDPVGSASTVANSPQVTGATLTFTSTTGTATVNLGTGNTSYSITLTESVVVSFTGTTTQKFIFSVVGDGSSTLSFDGSAAFSTDLPSFTLTPASGKVAKVAAQYDATVTKACILAKNGDF